MSQPQTAKTGAERIYKNRRPTDAPVFLKTRGLSSAGIFCDARNETVEPDRTMNF